MSTDEVLNSIISKRDFSQLPKKDVELAFKKFEKRQCSDEEKVRLTRDLLRKVYSAFVSSKLLNIKDKSEEWFLRKHLSTRERQGNYEKLYNRIIKQESKTKSKVSIFDLGAGINGFSYGYFPKNLSINYTAVEAVGQLVELMNSYFKKNRLNANAIHESLFELEKIKKLIKEKEGTKFVFLFKVLDSLEMLEPDYSKKLLQEITPLCDNVIVSFATRSMIKREKFKVNRKWIIDFIKEQFNLMDDFEIGNERYIVFKKN